MTEEYREKVFLNTMVKEFIKKYSKRSDEDVISVLEEVDNYDIVEKIIDNYEFKKTNCFSYLEYGKRLKSRYGQFPRKIRDLVVEHIEKVIEAETKFLERKHIFIRTTKLAHLSKSKAKIENYKDIISNPDLDVPNKLCRSFEKYYERLEHEIGEERNKEFQKKYPDIYSKEAISALEEIGEYKVVEEIIDLYNLSKCRGNCFSAFNLGKRIRSRYGQFPDKVKKETIGGLKLIIEAETLLLEHMHAAKDMESTLSKVESGFKKYQELMNDSDLNIPSDLRKDYVKLELVIKEAKKIVENVRAVKEWKRSFLKNYPRLLDERTISALEQMEYYHSVEYALSVYDTKEGTIEDYYNIGKRIKAKHRKFPIKIKEIIIDKFKRITKIGLKKEMEKYTKEKEYKLVNLYEKIVNDSDLQLPSSTRASMKKELYNYVPPPTPLDLEIAAGMNRKTKKKKLW